MATKKVFNLTVIKGSVILEPYYWMYEEPYDESYYKSLVYLKNTLMVKRLFKAAYSKRN